MANIFKLTKDYVNPPKRNSYDLSYQNDFTAKFGTLYPIFIKEVNPGDSFSIQTSLGIRAEPMVFPVQSKIRADVHYFYVRNRTLWENWMDFIGKVDDTIEHPYIVQPNSFFKSKTLADFLGVPTSIVGGTTQGVLYPANPYAWNGKRHYPTPVVTAVSFEDIAASSIDSITIPRVPVSSLNNNNLSGSYTSFIPTFSSLSDVSSIIYPDRIPFRSFRTVADLSQCSVTSISPIITIDDAISCVEYLCGSDRDSDVLYRYNNPIFNVNTFYSGSFLISDAKLSFFYSIVGDNEVSNYMTITRNMFTASINSSYSFVDIKLSLSDANGILPYLREIKSVGGSKLFFSLTITSPSWESLGLSSINAGYGDDGYVSFGNIVEFPYISRDLSYDSSDSQFLPWVTYSSANTASLKLSALPFRAYEAIYNSYYRNYMNNPFMLNGKPQYNRYVTNLGDGADTTPYKLFNRNWELDFLTSAQQSPQQGEAPLVGITVNPNSTATMKFKSSELESAGVANGEVTATVEIDENTNVLGISYYDEQLPQSNLKRLMEAINYGISINDLRQTTALQRWLEKNILKGYRYIDQVKSHFGVDVSYRDLLMPEFIGGHSQAINTITISQTTPTGDSPLGSYGGQAISKSSSENTVTKYCDEAGFIIGIMSIVPTPVYSQVPQQFFYKSNVLDYYFPEFGSIGMQPIFNKDITPLQTDKDKLDDVFGYQRPWWHLISSIDEVHGEFRTNRQGYLIQRMFEETPILNGDFLTINNDAINNVFYVDDEQSDQFLCQAYFKVTKKTAIPLFGVPSIENADVN